MIHIHHHDIDTSEMKVDEIKLEKSIDIDTSEMKNNTIAIKKGDDDIYESYERKVKRNRCYELLYDTMDDYNIDSDASSDSSIFENKKTA